MGASSSNPGRGATAKAPVPSADLLAAIRDALAVPGGDDPALAQRARQVHDMLAIGLDTGRPSAGTMRLLAALLRATGTGQ